MSATVFVAKPKADHLMLPNDSGAAVVDGEFAVVGGIAAIADQAIDSAAVGSFDVEEGIVLEATDLATGEDTFGTPGQAVYWNPTTKKFSDTKTVGYYKVGTLIAAKASGVIRFVKFFHAEPVPTIADCGDFSGTPTNNDTLKYVSSTGKWTVVAVAD